MTVCCQQSAYYAVTHSNSARYKLIVGVLYGGPEVQYTNTMANHKTQQQITKHNNKSQNSKTKILVTN